MKYFLVSLLFFYSVYTSLAWNDHRIKKRFNWRQETNVYWSENCDWNDNDLSNVQIPGDQCGSRCAQTSACTHFTWTNHNGGTCWMKKNAVSLDKAQYRQEYSVCGMMKSSSASSQFNWREESNLYWAENCDWNDNDLSNVKIPGEQCGSRCAQTSGCTHFVWTNYNGGTCWMKKNAVNRDQAKTIQEYSVCGIMKSGTSPPSPPSCSGSPQVKTINNCAFPVWVGAYGQQSTPENGGWKLNPGESKTVNIQTNGALWSGRFWGRTDCDANGRCATGQCSGLQCQGTTGQTPATLAEITFNGAGGQDFYDVSLVDGYNLQVKMRPMANTYSKVGSGTIYDCGEAGCNSDLNANCPQELAVKKDGRTVGCKSACEVFQTNAYCCRGPNNTPQTCPPFDYSRKFKNACPKAYSYAYDDATSTFICRGANGAKGASYEVQFC